MKIELVEFYPYTPTEKQKVDRFMLGTVHVYLIDEELDLRGIQVKRMRGKTKGIIFLFPHVNALDPETKERVRYPLVRFTNEEKHKQLLDFLHEQVKPLIKERLLIKGE